MFEVITISGKARHGKDTTAEMLQYELERQGYNVAIVHYADMLKYIARQYFHWNGEKDEQGRTLLQRLGTDVAREKDEDFWVEMLCSIVQVFFSDKDIIIIPDARFINEIDFWWNCKKCFKVASIHVTRMNYESELTAEQQNHRSETELDNYDFDYYFEAPDLNTLQKLVHDFCNSNLF